MASKIMIGQLPIIIEGEENVEPFGSSSFEASSVEVNQNIESFGSSSSDASSGPPNQNIDQNIEPFGSSYSGASNGQTSNSKKLEVPPTGVLSFASDDELKPSPDNGNANIDNVGGSKSDVLKRKRYHRHTAHQIQEMEAFFNKCPHPNERQRRELGHELGLEPLQVKFWFQNKRTQFKAQDKHMENTELRIQNEILRTENVRFREVLAMASCPSCDGPQAIAHSSSETNGLRIENARLREEIDKIRELAIQVFDNAFANQDNAFPSVNLNVSHHLVNFNAPNEEPEASAFGGEEQPNVDGDVSEEEDLITSLGRPNEFDKQMIINLADSAMEELIKLTQIDHPLWVQSIDQRHYMLNEEVYSHMFTRIEGFATPLSFRVEATRDTDIIMTNQMHLIEIMMNMEKFLSVFHSMVSRGSLLEVILIGKEAGYDGALHLITAEYQVLTPSIPTRESTFARYCKKLEKDIWAVVDVSFEDMDKNLALNKCHKMPSGCIIQAIPCGRSRVTWIEHVKLEDEGVHPIGKPFVDSCLAFGARRWLAILKRQCERLATVVMQNFPPNDINTTVLANPQGRKNILKLGERMVISFCSGVASSNANSWLKRIGNGGDEVRIMTKTSKNELDKTCVIILSVITSFWIPIHHEVVFEFLRDETTRKEWDILARTWDIQEFVHITNGHQAGNCVSMLRVIDTSTGSSMVILQECNNDPVSSSVIYAPVDPCDMKTILSGGILDNVKLLPSGFTIYPSERPPLPLRLKGDGTNPIGLDASTLGSLVTMAFQIPTDPLTNTTSLFSIGSDAIINNLIETTVQRLKCALLSNIV